MRFHRFLDRPFRYLFYLQAALYIAIYVSSLLSPASVSGVGLPINDKVLHFAAHLTLAVSLYLAFRSFGARFPVKWSLAITLVMAISTELGQHLVPGREPSLWDFAANLAGLILGYLIILTIRNYARKHLGASRGT